MGEMSLENLWYLDVGLNLWYTLTGAALGGLGEWKSGERSTGWLKKSKLLYCVNSLLFLSHPALLSTSKACFDHVRWPNKTCPIWEHKPARYHSLSERIVNTQRCITM